MTHRTIPARKRPKGSGMLAMMLAMSGGPIEGLALLMARGYIKMTMPPIQRSVPSTPIIRAKYLPIFSLQSAFPRFALSGNLYGCFK